MLFYAFTVGDNEYKLRLNTRNIVVLEKELGCNPLMIFGKGDRMPKVSEMVDILHASMQQYHHEITKAKAYEIFDLWLSDNNTISDFIPVILEVYKVSGIIEDTEEHSEKN